MKEHANGDCGSAVAQCLQDQFLLYIRDGALHKLSELRDWLALRVAPEVAATGMHPKKVSKSSTEYALILKKVVESLRRTRLLAVRNQDEVQATPLKDARFTIAPEFEHLLPRAPDEVAKLEQLLLVDGCRDELVVWKERKVLVDGHTRYRLLSLLGRPYRILEKSFPDREAVIAWIIQTHYGRRNLSEEFKSYLRGKQYLNEKQQHGGDRRSSPHNGTLKTSELVAQRYGVSKNTIERDAGFAGALDKLVEISGDDVRQKVLSRVAKWTRKDVERIATLDNDKIKEIVKTALTTGKRPRFAGTLVNKPNGFQFPRDKPGTQLKILKRLIGIKGLVRLYHAIALVLKKRPNRLR